MLIPAITFGPTRANDVDDARVLEFLDKISVLGPVIVSIEDLDENATEQEANRLLLKRIIDKTNTNSLTPCYLEGLKIDQDELATQLLDAGLHGIFFRQPAPAETLELELLSKVLASFPRARVGVSVHISEALAAGPAQAVAEYIERVVAANRANAIHYYVQVHTSSQQVLEAVRDVAKALVQRSTSLLDNVQLYLGIPPALPRSTKMAAKISTSTTDNTIHAVFRPRPLTDPAATSSSSSSSSNSGSAGEGGIDLPEDGVDTLSAFISCIRSDRPDGLFTTVVCDEHGVSLGLVYSNDVSIRAAVHEKKGIYWSRSRGGLWRKGDSSGMYQELLAVALDCDGDALRFTVVQHGTPPAFCHLMTRTCWGDVHGLQHLQSILRARLVGAPEGSYTKRLFTDHTLLKKKLVEEAQELAEATTHDDVAGEAADLMYFLMTRCVAAGVSLRDIERKLDDRSLKVTRRPGNAKAWRDENAAKILAGGVTTGAEGDLLPGSQP